MHAQQAERDEQRERGFRAVCGGAERVEAEDGNAGDGADVFGALFAGGERAAKEQVLDARGDCHAIFVRQSRIQRWEKVCRGDCLMA